MYNSEFWQLHVLTGDHSNQTNLIAARVVRTTNETTKPQIGIRPYVPQAIPSICLIIVWAVAVFIFLPGVWKFILNRKLTSNHRLEVPCRNCEYFQHNDYLNCAVHPSVVLTEQALNCSDYCSTRLTKNEIPNK